MAHITDLVAPRFTGHVGPVRFVRGHAETDDTDLVAYFAADPDRYAVTDTDEPRTEVVCADCAAQGRDTQMVEDNGAGDLCPLCDDHLDCDNFPCSGYDGEACVLNTPTPQE